jgi:hypothetical protein
LRQLSERQPDSHLFLYWCGHGFTDAITGRPLLICSDWSDDYPTSVVDRKDLIETLHSDEYDGLRSQIILFDTCANNIPSRYSPGRTISTWNGSIDQICYSAAPRGQLAWSDDSGGYFTRLVLGVLDHLPGWPDLDTFISNLDGAIRTAGHDVSRVYYRRGNGDEIALYGPNAARDALIARLMALPIGPSLLWPLYLLVVSGLGPGAGRGHGQTIASMVESLWNANGRADGAVAPYPAVEFAMRVRNAFKETAAELDAWIDEKKFVAPADRDEARRRLADERNALYLVVEIHESKSALRVGEIEWFDARLLGYDHARAVEPWSVARQDVRSWEDLAEKVRPLLNQAKIIAERLSATLTIEFLTNVFDIDPHRITLAIGEPDTIGEHNPVVLRWRQPRSPEVKPFWVERAEKIRRGSIATSLLAVTAHDKLEDCCVLFVRYVLPPGSRPPHPHPQPPGWNLIRRAISSGVPFICWPLAESPTGDLSEYERELAAWIRESRPIDRVPARVRHERLVGEIAADVSVFWDDPLPTYQLRELRTR